jgi:signal peptidase
VVKKSPEYNVGDIISYYAKINGKEEIVTHRIFRIGGNVYLTKGDANQALDEEKIVPRLIIGKVVLVIPYLGYLIGFAKTKIGLWLLIVLPALFIILSEVIMILKITIN